MLVFTEQLFERKGKEMNYSRKIDRALNKAIQRIIKNKEEYVKNPKTDFTRNRKLNMEKLIRLMLSMKSTALKQSLHQLIGTSNEYFTSSAFVQQRSKISSKVFKDIFYNFNAMCKDTKTYRGYRIFAVDGTDVNCPRNPESENFMRNSKCTTGYNLMHMNALYDLMNKTYVDVITQPYKVNDEQGALVDMLRRNTFQGKNILTADRGYESYNVIATLIEAENLDFVIRLKHGSGAMYHVQQLPMIELDVDVFISITTTQTKEDKLHKRRYIQTMRNKDKIYSDKTNKSRWDHPSPYDMTIRIVRVLLDNGEYETLATSLPREEFSTEDIKDIYHIRWGIETAFRDLKYTLGLKYLHSKKDDSILQEIYSTLIMYNYCSRIAGSVEIQQISKRKHMYKVNFSMAVTYCKEFYSSWRKNNELLMKNMCRNILPDRPGRHAARNVRTTRFAGFTNRPAT